MDEIQFEDNRVKVKDALRKGMTTYLYEAAGALEAQTKRNSQVDTGQTKNSWTYLVKEHTGEAFVGNPRENALWEEFGTGEYALRGNGRKGGWFVHESQLSEKAKARMKRVIGKGGEVYYFTYGKRPTRPLWYAFVALKGKITARLGAILAEEFKGG